MIKRSTTFFLSALLSAFAVTPTLVIAGPVLTEFMASNDQTIEDEDVDEPDWIEIAAEGGSANLEGYYLTNDRTNLIQWQLPAVNLSSGDHLLIFASGKNRKDPAGVLHANFRLTTESGYVALVAPDGQSIVTEYDYPEQVTDISYGKSDGNTGYFADASPGAANDGPFASALPAEDPVFSQGSGLFKAPVSITIAPPESPDAVVRVAIDSEDEPTEQSPEYTAAIAVAETTTIRARVFEPGKLPGPIRSITLIHTDDDELLEFSSDIPITLIKNLESRTFNTSTRAFQTAYTLIFDGNTESGRSSIASEPTFHSRGGMHVRGQSSSGFPKKQYRWEIWDEEGNDRDQEIMGMPADGDWVIHAPYSDKTLMRNVVVYDTARALSGSNGGVRTRFTEVFFDTSSENGSMSMSDYAGVYVMMERIERGQDRVDISKLNELSNSDEQLTGGYIYKKDKPPHQVTLRTKVERQTLDFVDPQDPSTAQKNYLGDYINAFEEALHDEDLRGDPNEGYAKYIDVQSWIDNHIFVELYKEIDGYRISAYYVKDRGQKIRATPVWDYNLSLGNADYLGGQNPRGSYYPQISKFPSADAQYPWYPQLFKDQEFEKQYWDRYFELRRTVFDEQTQMDKIDAFAEELKEAQERNFDKWKVLGTYLWPNAAGFRARTTHQDEVDWMKDWLHDRLEWFDSQWINPPVFSQRGGSVPSGYQLQIDTPADQNGTVFYTIDGTDPQPNVNGEVTNATVVSETAAVQWWVPDSDAAGTPEQWASVAGPANLSAWETGQGGVGFERNETGALHDLVMSNTQEKMLGNNATAYIRIPFQIESEEAVRQASALMLRMRFDDGFVAYINGVEVARANAPDELTWNSEATSSNSDSKAVVFKDFDASAGVAGLQAGTNILAIHGMNTGAGGSDALWNAELDARFVALPTAGNILRYSAPLALTSDTYVKARVRDGEDWGALTEAVFVVGGTPASAANIAITELDYRPADTTVAEDDAGFSSRRLFEYLVIRNLGNSTVDLSGAAFTDGIAFQFDSNELSSVTLAPGENGILVSNLSAFLLRYGAPTAGTGYKILGEFEGNLANGGEDILLLDASGSAIRQFSYDDAAPWPGEADGTGMVLTVKDPLADATDPANWVAQSPLAGFTVDPGTGDSDGDLIPDVIEVAMGTNPNDRHSFAVPVASYEDIEVNGITATYATITYPVDSQFATALPFETSSTLSDWESADTQLIEVRREDAGGNIEIVTLRTAAPVSEVPWKYFRIHMPAN